MLQYVFTGDPVPDGCGDISQELHQPSATITFTLPGPREVRLRSTTRRATGAVFDTTHAIEWLSGEHSRGMNRLIDFQQFDLFGVGITAHPEPAGSELPFARDGRMVAAAQFWAHIDQPSSFGGFAFDSGYSTQGPRVTLNWTNSYSPFAPQYRSEIAEGATPDYTSLLFRGQGNSFTTEPGPENTTRQFWVRHTADPATELNVTLVRPFSGSRGASVAVPPKIRSLITGTDAIEASGFYTWDANPSGGTPPNYHFQWYYQEHDGTGAGPIFSVGGDAQQYTRLVKQRETYFFFRLIVTVYDENRFWADSADMLLVFVDAEGGDMGFESAVMGAPTESAGGAPRRAFVDTDGRCVVVPADRAERQRFYWRLWQAPQGIRACDPRSGTELGGG